METVIKNLAKEGIMQLWVITSLGPCWYTSKRTNKGELREVDII